MSAIDLFQELGFDLTRSSSNGLNLFDALLKGKFCYERMNKLMDLSVPVLNRNLEALYPKINADKMSKEKKEELLEKLKNLASVQGRTRFNHVWRSLRSNKPRGWAKKVNPYVAKEIAMFI